jgi:multidrug resistance efflux pump
MQLKHAIKTLVVVGAISVGTVAKADEGIASALKSTLRKAGLAKQSQAALSAARSFDADPTVANLAALEKQIARIQRKLKQTRDTLSAVQSSISAANYDGAGAADPLVRTKALAAPAASPTAAPSRKPGTGGGGGMAM